LEIGSIPSFLDIFDLFGDLLFFLSDINDFVNFVFKVVKFKVDNISEGGGRSMDIDLFTS
jgi:hypothetical protein